MRIPRIYTPQSLSEQTEIELDESASHHCLKVLRMDTGRALFLFNGDGRCFPATIISKTKKRATVRTDKTVTQNTESSLSTHLAIAVSRGNRFDLVLQKATELGVTRITPLLTERTEFKAEGERIEKKIDSWNRILISACEQCGRNTLPKLDSPRHFSQFIAEAKAEHKFVLHHRNTTAPSADIKSASVILLIGPEGGLSEAEITLAHSHTYSNLALGPRVLRTETAPIVALSVFQYLWGDI